jgi:predicted acyltransferase
MLSNFDKLTINLGLPVHRHHGTSSVNYSHGVILLLLVSLHFSESHSLKTKWHYLFRFVGLHCLTGWLCSPSIERWQELSSILHDAGVHEVRKRKHTVFLKECQLKES